MTDETPPFPILRTKLHRPPLTVDLVPRFELLVWLDRHRRQPLTLVSAPAGYGKTTLVSHWIDTLDRPTVWLSLDEQDDDLAVFLTYVTAALRTLFPAACRDTLALLNARSLPPLAVLVRRFSNDLEALEGDVTLVLDDYHVIHDMAIHDLLSEVLRHPPRPLHLVLMTRRDPPLSLATLRARDRLTELRQQDLRFTVAETARFLEQMTGLEVVGTVAAALHAKTEGWVLGLRLAALFHRHQGDFDLLLRYLPDQVAYVSEYLMSEVLSQQPLDVQDFLVRTSILNRFCASLCEAVRGEGAFSGVKGHEADISTSEALLEYLHTENLFLIPQSHEPQWYRYHALAAGETAYAVQVVECNDLVAAGQYLAVVQNALYLTCAFPTPHSVLALALTHQAQGQANNPVLLETSGPLSVSVPALSTSPLVEPLTTRELDILELLAQRYQDKEIADQLSIALTTVKTHLKPLYQKLQVSTRRQAVAQGQALGLLTHR